MVLTRTTTTTVVALTSGQPGRAGNRNDQTS